MFCFDLDYDLFIYFYLFFIFYFQGVLVYFQLKQGETLRIKPLTWGHGLSYGLPGIWVVTCSILLQKSSNSLESCSLNHPLLEPCERRINILNLVHPKFLKLESSHTIVKWKQLKFANAFHDLVGNTLQKYDANVPLSKSNKIRTCMQLRKLVLDYYSKRAI